MEAYATQMDAARRGIVTREMEIVAKKERMTVEELMPLVASGKVESSVVVGNLQVGSLVGCLWNRQRREEFLHLCLPLVRVDVADDDDCLVCRVIPLILLVAQTVGVAVVDDVHASDDGACAIAAVRIEVWQSLIEQALWCSVAAVLVVDDVTLLVELLLVEGQSFRPVAQQKQAAVEGALTVVAHAIDVVDGVVGGSEGVPLCSESVHELRY